MDAEPWPPQRAPRSLGIGQRLEKIAADDPERVDVAARRMFDHLDSGPAATRRHWKSPEARPSRGSRRFHSRHAADFRAALDAGVAANRHEPAIEPAGQAAREPHVHERLDRLDAVRVLRQPH